MNNKEVEMRMIANVIRYMKRENDEEYTTQDSIDYIESHGEYAEDNPAVYVCTYHKYVSGSLFGMWVDITSFADYEDMWEFFRAIHGDEEDPEIMCNGYQNYPQCLYKESGFDEDDYDNIMEWWNLDDDDTREAAEVYLENMGADDLSNFEESYQGRWDSEIDFAWHIFEECYAPEVSDFCRKYFDIEAFARDLFFDYTFVDGFVFS